MAAIMCMSVMSGCGQKNAQSNENSEQQGQPDAVQQTEAYTKQDITVAALKGPTAIGMAQIMKNAKEGKAENNYTRRMSSLQTSLKAMCRLQHFLVTPQQLLPIRLTARFR